MSRKLGNLDRLETLLGAMANRHRLTVLYAIRSREMTEGEICRLTGLSQSALSQHLAKLRVLGMVATRRDAQTIYYRCDSKAVSLILDALADLPGDTPDKFVA
jgi:DNA-binding transcriptional ArsR family regulator